MMAITFIEEKVIQEKLMALAGPAAKIECQKTKTIESTSISLQRF